MKLFPEELRLTLTPGRVCLQRLGSGQVESLLDEAGPGMDLSGLAEILGRDALRTGPIRVLVSDAWVRYNLIPVDAHSLEDEDARLLAEAHFLRQYGTPVWPQRMTALAGALLVAGISPPLLAALESGSHGEATSVPDKSAARGAWQLAGVEPLFSWLMDQAGDQLRRFTGWLVADEGEVLVLAFLEEGRLTSLRSQYCGENLRQTLLELLARQAALNARSDKNVLHHSLVGRPLSLPGPWQLAPLNPVPRSRFSRLLSFLRSR